MARVRIVSSRPPGSWRSSRASAVSSSARRYGSARTPPTRPRTRPSGLARYSARSATATSASLVRPSSGIAGDADADRDGRAAGRPRTARRRRAGSARRPRGRPPGRRRAGWRRTRRRRSGTAGRRRGSRPPMRAGDARPGTRRRPGGRSASLNALNASRSSISTANGSPADAASTASPSSRWNAPWLRSPVRASCSARTRTAPCVSAFWRAIEAWPANSLVSSNSLALNAASASPIRPMLSVPIGLARRRAAGRRSSTRARTACRAPGSSAGRGGPRWPGPPRRGR